MIIKLRDKVETILREDPNARNSDVTLTILIWMRFHPEKIEGDYLLLGHLYNLPREDNIKRIRAKFNASGKYLPTDLAIAKRRGIKEEEWRSALGYPSTKETKNPGKVKSYTKKPPVEPDRLFDLPPGKSKSYGED